MDIDLDSVQAKGKRSFALIGILVAASLFCLFFGYLIGDCRLKSNWLDKTKKGCDTTAKTMNLLRKGVDKFKRTFDDEVDKTKQFKYYRPDLFSNLNRDVEDIDVAKPKFQALLNTTIWQTHYKFVKGSKDVLPRLHNFLALLNELRNAVQAGVRMDRTLAEHLEKKKEGYKEKIDKKPRFGVVIQGQRNVMFAVLEDPIDDKGSRLKTTSGAKGYIVMGKNVYFVKPPKTAKECPEYGGSLFLFDNRDLQLMGRMKCKGFEDVYFAAWKAQVVRVAEILKEIAKVDPKAIRNAFRKSAG